MTTKQERLEKLANDVIFAAKDSGTILEAYEVLLGSRGEYRGMVNAIAGTVSISVLNLHIRTVCEELGLDVVDYMLPSLVLVNRGHSEHRELNTLAYERVSQIREKKDRVIYVLSYLSYVWDFDCNYISLYDESAEGLLSVEPTAEGKALMELTPIGTVKGLMKGYLVDAKNTDIRFTLGHLLQKDDWDIVEGLLDYFRHRYTNYDLIESRLDYRELTTTTTEEGTGYISDSAWKLAGRKLRGVVEELFFSYHSRGGIASCCILY